MIPLRDDVPTRTVPFVNYAVIVVCVLVFLAEATSPDGGERLVYQYGMIPARVSGQESRPQPDVRTVAPWERFVPRRPEPPASAVPPWATLFTCMFLHGGLMHILGNMLFLYIFGDNVEDRYGHLGYAAMYLGSGVAAGLLHLASAPASPIPTVGASGAIAGVMGAYLVMFPHARVMTLIPLGIFTQIVAVPAGFFLGLWFLIQLASATGSSAEAAGVAFWAHVGGFVVGLGLTWLLCRTGTLNRREPQVHPMSAWERRRLPWN